MTGSAIAGALAFTWLGMVLAISFLEAPLKFRAPGITLKLGLGIGRLVFRALNLTELVLGIAIALILGLGFEASPPWLAFAVPFGMLLIQVLAVRPALTKRTNAVLAGHEGPRSHAHLLYVGCDLVKIAGLVWLGIACLSGS